MKKLTVLFLLLSSLVSTAQPLIKQADGQSRPWTFWYWMYGAVSDTGIRLDLQAMKDAGIAGFYLMPIKDVTDGAQYEGTARQLTPEWWRHIDTVCRVADSLGLQMGIHFSDGFALGGGPWIRPEESMQRVVWTDTIVEGGSAPHLERPQGHEGYYEDIATFAYPVDGRSEHSEYSEHSESSGNAGNKVKASVEFPFRSTEPCDIIFEYDQPFTLRQIRIVTGGNNYQAHRWQLYASDDGHAYHHVRDITPARQGWQNTDAQATYAIPTTRARYFKMHWTPEGSEPGCEDMDAAKWRPTLKVARIEMGSEPVVDGYEGKSGMVWRVSAPFALADADCVAPTQLRRLTLDGDLVTEKLPKGRWRVLRMGHTSTGHTNATGGGGRGLECDKFSRTAIRKQLDHWFGAIYERAPKTVLTRLHVDSWECGSQNWSKTFADEFARRRGYDLLPWLPVYAGVPIASSEQTDQVLRDIRQTIADLIDEVFFDEVEQAAKRYGVALSTECVAPTMVSDGLRHYRHATYPMGEFWLNSPTHDKPNDMLDAISGAHIYGKRVILAEGFTEVRGTWDETPAMLKPLLDRNFCLGINGIVFHVFTHNPWTDRHPGMTLDGIGTFFQRDNTWWREMPAFTRYITNCQELLQEGQPVVDLAVYIGDEVPRRALLPERLTDMLPGLLGDSLLRRETARMANEGQPMETSPVGVSHTRNMTKAEDWVNPLHGYKYDSFNHDVLSGMRVENGEVVTRDGMRYKALVIPKTHTMNPAGINTARKEIEALRRQGATIIDTPWTSADLSALGFAPDIVLPTGLDYTHRHTSEGEIYFISNQTPHAITFALRVRESRRHRYLLDPLSDRFTIAGDSVTLEPYASIFYELTDDDLSILAEKEPIARRTQTLDGEWNIRFEENGMTGTDTLRSWTTYDDPRMRYYSGHAAYEKAFKHKGKGRTWIQMDEVHDIATVYVNGICCGTSWLPPHRIEITDAVRKGKNQLRIEVVNTWANALQGADNGTPPFDGIWTNGKYRRAEKDLLPAGLLTPPRIISEK